MTCREVIDFLLEYVDGELPAESRAVFERHLAACPECREYLATYQTTIALGRAACQSADAEFADPPAELISAILASRASRSQPG